MPINKRTVVFYMLIVIACILTAYSVNVDLSFYYIKYFSTRTVLYERLSFLIIYVILLAALISLIVKPLSSIIPERIKVLYKKYIHWKGDSIRENSSNVRTDFRNSNLTGAIFKKSYINKAEFTGANLTAAMFDSACIKSAVFNDTNLVWTSLRNVQAVRLRRCKNTILSDCPCKSFRFSLRSGQDEIVRKSIP